MAYLHFHQQSFNAGELSPLMAARVTADQYQSGCAKMENFIPRVQGGAFKRPGLEHCGFIKGSEIPENTAVLLHGFRRSTETNYILEFGHEYIRLWKGGETPSQVSLDIGDVDDWAGSSSGGAWVTATGYTVGNQRTNKGIVFRCIQAHTSGASSEPGAGANWSLYWAEIAEYEIGDTVKDGGVIYYCKTKHYPSATFATDAAYWAAFTDEIYEIPTAYAAVDVENLRFCQLNDVLFIAHPDYPPKRLSRFGETHWVFEDVPFQFAPALDVNETRINVQVQFDGVPEFGLPWVTATEYQTGDRVHGVGAGVVGRVYECILGHTSSAAGAGGNEPGIGATWTTNWTLISSTGYAVGDRVTGVDNGSTINPYAGQIFTCHTAYNPGTTSNDEPGTGSAWQDYWNEGTSSIKIALWANKTAYVQGQKVRRGKTIYECIRAHTSALNSTPVRPGGSYVKGNSPGDGDLWARVWKVSAADTDLSGLEFALFATEDLFTEDDVGTTWLLELGSGGNYEQISIPAANQTASTENYPLFVQGGFLVTSTWNSDDAMLGTITVQESLDGVIWSTIKQFTQVNKKDGNISYTGEAPTTGAWYRLSATATDNSTATTKLKIEATSAVIKLPFKITALDGTTPATKALGNLVMPKDQLPPPLVMGTSTPLWRRPAFSERDGYPSSVAFHDSRIWWAGTRNYPARLWASQTEDYYTFLTGALDTDGLDLTLAAVESNAIQWIASFNRSLVIGTTGDEWTVDSGETDEALKPTNIRARRRTRYGSEGLPPQLTGESLLWVQRGGNKLREFSYIFQKDGFEAPDMSVLAEHLVNGKIKQITYQASPEPIVWAVDGTYFYSFVYNREHSVTAWSKHSFKVGGGFFSIAVIYGDPYEEVWMVFNDEIVRLNPTSLNAVLGPSDAVQQQNFLCYLDSALLRTGTWDGTQTKFICHRALIGYQLSQARILVYTTAGEIREGTVININEVVVDGPALSSNEAWVGVEMTAQLETMDMHVMLQNGSSFMRNHRIDRISLRLIKSKGGSVYIPPYLDQALDEIQYPASFVGNVNFTGQIEPFPLNSSFAKKLSIGVYSTDPYPMNVLSIGATLEVTGD